MGDIGRLMCRREQSTERRVWRMKKVYIRVDIGFGFVRVRATTTRFRMYVDTVGKHSVGLVCATCWPGSVSTV
jgi:hypothetical protein